MNILKHYKKKLLNIIIYLMYNIYMDVAQDIEVIEKDVKDCNEKCHRVNCYALYDAIMASLKVLYDLIFVCCKKRD
jgi:hypothetical protein